jgi:hypothetical protein
MMWLVTVLCMLIVFFENISAITIGASSGPVLLYLDQNGKVLSASGPYGPYSITMYGASFQGSRSTGTFSSVVAASGLHSYLSYLNGAADQCPAGVVYVFLCDGFMALN